jgi:hypothetical protein
MSKFLHIAVSVALAASAVACSADDVTGPRTVAEQLRGTWAESARVPGSSTVITLAVADTTITGTGTYTIEAGQPGTIVVTGMITGGVTVDLQLVRSDGWMGYFRGTLASPDSLSGFSWGHSTNTTLAVADPAPDNFHRVVP